MRSRLSESNFSPTTRLTRRELGKRFVEKWPGRNGQVLVAALERRVPLVHSPATSSWGRWGSPAGVAVVRAEVVVGEMSVSQPEALIRRYLAGFGPAAVSDFQSWSGLTRTGEIFERMRPGLRVYRTEQGELFDLPDAAVVDIDVPAPVRFLPAFDNVLLGHADRTRIISDEDRKVVMPGGAQVVPTFLVDGFVAGTWSLRGSELLVKAFRPLSREQGRSEEGGGGATRVCWSVGWRQKNFVRGLSHGGR